MSAVHPLRTLAGGENLGAEKTLSHTYPDLLTSDRHDALDPASHGPSARRGLSGGRRFCREIVNFLLVVNFRGTASPPKHVTLTKVRTSV